MCVWHKCHITPWHVCHITPWHVCHITPWHEWHECCHALLLDMNATLLLGMCVDMPAEHLTVEATGEEIAGSTLVRPRHRAHHPGMSLHTETEHFRWIIKNKSFVQGLANNLSLNSPTLQCFFTFENKIAQGNVFSENTYLPQQLTKYCQTCYLRVQISGNRHFTCPM